MVVIARRAILSALAVLAVSVAGAADAQGLNPFGAYWQNIAHSVEQNDAAGVQSLLVQGQSPNGTDEEGRAALAIAAINGNVRIASMLVKAGATIDIRDSLGNTPLYYAADHDHTDVVQLLLDAGASVDPQNRSGATPLMAGAQRGSTEIVRVLLAKGADPGKNDYTGRDALAWADEGHSPAVVRLLRDAAAATPLERDEIGLNR
jgi:ankyrin repeat protein